MFFSVDKRVPRALTSLLPALVLTGCFYGEGSGPTPLAGTPAPPPDPIPEGFCDVINFEDVCGPFDFVGGGNEPGFEGGVSLIIDNPDMSGLNATEKVVQMQKFRAESGKTFGGSTLQLPQGFDFSEGEAFTMLVWASRDVPINFKLEGLGQERVANQSGSSSWEELCFDFTGTAAGGAPVTGITFIFDVNELGDAAVNPDDWTFYYDEITQVESCGDGGGPGPGPATLGPVDFEVDGQGEAFAWTVFENDDNPPLQIIDNPDASGANTSARVAQFTARQAGQPFAGFVTQDLPTFTLDASNAIVKIKVWKSVISNVGIKFEDAATGSTGEILVANTEVDQWEELEFDFSGVIGDPNNTDITGLVIFPDFDARAADNVVYIDDITFSAVGGGGGGGQVALPVTFDDAGVDYDLVDFGDPVAAATTLVADPTDAGNTVASTNKPPGTPVWAGTTVGGTNGLASAIPFTATETSMTVRVYSPDAGIPVRLKVEDASDNTISVETEALTTVANAWETLTFDFSNEVGGTAALNVANTYDKASIFFNFGTDGDTAGDKTYLWDDVEFVSGGGGGSVGDGTFVNGNFETGGLTGWTLTQVPVAVGSISADTSGQGGRAGTVARLIAAGAVGQENDVLISQEGLAAGTVASGDSIDVSFDLYGSLTGGGGVVFVEIIFLNAAGEDVGGRDFVVDATLPTRDTPYTPTGTWTTYSGTVIAGTAVGGGQWDVSGGVVLSLKAACGPIDGCGVDASFDNVTFVINP